MQHYFSLLFSFIILSLSLEARAENTYGVRLLNHTNKTVSESGVGIATWLIVPNVVANPNQQLFLAGPSYTGKGYWVEVMFGPRIDAVDSVAWVNSNRFQLTPKFWGKPINVWGNLQFLDITNPDTMIPYTFLMVDYVLPEKKALIGIESENFYGLPPGGEETFNDISVGPQVVLPYKGLNVIMAYQFHTHENVSDQFWVRAMHHFGGFDK